MKQVAPDYQTVIGGISLDLNLHKHLMGDKVIWLGFGIIGGTMGVGKTAVSQQLKLELPNSVLLDGDWCWDASPFQVTDETKAMVTDNICYLLNNFLHCSVYENVIFCWVMHQQTIIDTNEKTVAMIANEII